MADEWLLDVRVRPVRDGIALVTVTGEIDIATVASLRSALSPPASDPAVRLLVCDLSLVSFMGCTAVSALLDIRRMLATREADLRLVADRLVVLRPLAMLGLLDVLPVSPDVTSALN